MKKKCINGGGCHPRITGDKGTWIYQGWIKNSYLVLHEKTLSNRKEVVFFEQADEVEGDSGRSNYGSFVHQADCYYCKGEVL
jgi:hypothetical protein